MSQLSQRLSPGETSAEHRFPRTQWSTLTTREFLRATENLPPGEEILQEHRTRLAELAYGRE